nr:MAG TPA: hypothetical protein [Caudoviricetes sp.]
MGKQHLSMVMVALVDGRWHYQRADGFAGRWTWD